MRIIIVGGSGTIGSAVANELKSRHELIIAGREHGDARVDIEDPASIEKMYQAVGHFDAVVSTTGKVHFGPLAEMTGEHVAVGLRNKLMGQINLVLIGQRHIQANGSFTLTSGILSQDPIRAGSSASLVNGGIDSFIKAAAIELSRGIRINGVSPSVLQESMDKYADYFRGFEPVSAARVALAYSKSIEGAQTGQIYPVV